jgi:hypothetical protein
MAALAIKHDPSQFQCFGTTVGEGYQRFSAHIAAANINIQSGGGSGGLRMKAV